MSALLIHQIQTLREATDRWQAENPGKKLALVPTMGALHEGHLQLIDHAHRHADAVIVSIFVNPTQFAPDEDLDAYPRTLAADCAACSDRGVRWVFAPSACEMYPHGDQTTVEVPQLSAGLCGRSRPHFFGGVARVVLKLLNIAQADVAVFGEKDYQQLHVIRRMAADLHHRTAILSAPTVREADGLAMSSRNRYLNATQRAAAAALPAALVQLAAVAARDPGADGLAAAVAAARHRIESVGGRIDYLEVVDAQSLAPITKISQPARVLVAAWLGDTRLIDNLPIIPT